MHWIDNIEPPIIFGHRGASRHSPENTIASFNMAIQEGAEAFELDTMLSEDRIPVVIHDRQVDRTTDGTGKIDQMSAAEIQTLDAGSSFSGEYSHEGVPLLEKVFMQFKDRALINVELKNHHSPFNGLADIVVEIALKVNVLDQILFSSFVPFNLVRIKRLIPSAKVALLYSRGTLRNLLQSKLFYLLSPEYIHPQFRDATESFIKKQHRMNRKINAWTGNKQSEMIRLFNLGVDGIITDDPKLARKIKSGMKK